MQTRTELPRNTFKLAILTNFDYVIEMLNFAFRGIQIHASLNLCSFIPVATQLGKKYINSSPKPLENRAINVKPKSIRCYKLSAVQLYLNKGEELVYSIIRGFFQEAVQDFWNYTIIFKSLKFLI